MKKILLGLTLATLVVAKPFCPDPMIRHAEKKYGVTAMKRFKRMNKILDEASGKSEHHILEEVNRFFNTVRYGSDMDIYQKKDYWATPWEFLGRDSGDSEDFAIAKYFALTHLGISPEKLYFTYVKSRYFKQPHVVLTYFETPSSVPLVLDNNLDAIITADRRQDLIPIYNFNAEILEHVNLSDKKNAAPSGRTHKQWDRLTEALQRHKL